MHKYKVKVDKQNYKIKVEGKSLTARFKKQRLTAKLKSIGLGLAIRKRLIAILSQFPRTCFAVLVLYIFKY